VHHLWAISVAPGQRRLRSRAHWHACRSAQWSHCITLWLGGYRSWGWPIPKRTSGRVGTKQLFCSQEVTRLHLDYSEGETINFLTVSTCAFPRNMRISHSPSWSDSPTHDTLELLPAHFAAHHKDSVETCE